MVKIENTLLSQSGKDFFKVIAELDRSVSPTLSQRISNWFSSCALFLSGKDSAVSEKVAVVSSFQGKVISVEFGVIGEMSQLVEKAKQAATPIQQNNLEISACVIKHPSSKSCELMMASKDSSISGFSAMTTSPSSLTSLLRKNLKLNPSQSKKVVDYFQAKTDAVRTPVQKVEISNRVSSFFESVKNLFFPDQEIIVIAHSHGKLVSIQKRRVSKEELNLDKAKCYAQLVKASKNLLF